MSIDITVTTRNHGTITAKAADIAEEINYYTALGADIADLQQAATAHTEEDYSDVTEPTILFTAIAAARGTD